MKQAPGNEKIWQLLCLITFTVPAFSSPQKEGRVEHNQSRVLSSGLDVNETVNHALSTTHIYIDGSVSDEYNIRLAVKYNDNNVYLYESTLEAWVKMDNTEFGDIFTYQSYDLTPMTKATATSSHSAQMDVTGNCGNREWSLESAENECTMTCDYSGESLSETITDYINKKENSYENGSYCYAKSGDVEGHFDYAALISAKVIVNEVLNYPISSRGFYVYSSDSNVVASDINCCGAEVVSDTFSIGVTVNAQVREMNAVISNGKERMLAYESGPDGYRTYMLDRNGDKRAIPEDFEGDLSSTVAYASTDDYVTTGAGGTWVFTERYLIQVLEKEMPSYPVQLYKEIRKK